MRRGETPAGRSGSATGGERTGNGSLADRAAGLLAAAIRIRTVNPPGGEAPLASLFVEELRAAGVEARFVRTPSPPGGPRRAAAIARVRGRADGDALLLLSHLDVVGVRGTGWTEDPFAGVIRDGYVIGRGALDAKGLAVVHALALETLARRDRPLRRDVLMLAAPDEEAGGRDGLGWIARERPALLAGVRYALAEGGSVRVDPSQPPLWSVSVAEKSPCWLELRTRGTPGHAATPAPDAAVHRLIAALERVRRTPFPVHVVPEVARMYRAMAPMASRRDRRGFEDLAAALARDPEFARRFLRQRSNAALVRDTLAITVLEGAPATNVMPAVARARVDARLLPGERCDDLERRLRRRIADPGVEIVRLLSYAARSSSVATPLYEAIERVAQEVDPGARVLPRMSAGSSDAHWLREHGAVVYGFVPRWMPARETRGIHGPDERISIDNLERGVRTLVRIIEVFDELDR